MKEKTWFLFLCCMLVLGGKVWGKAIVAKYQNWTGGGSFELMLRDGTMVDGYCWGQYPDNHCGILIKNADFSVRTIIAEGAIESNGEAHISQYMGSPDGKKFFVNMCETDCNLDDDIIALYDTDGNRHWAKKVKFHLSDGSVVLFDYIVLSAINDDGIYIRGSLYSKRSYDVLMKINYSGELVWYKKYNSIRYLSDKAKPYPGIYVPRSNERGNIQRSTIVIDGRYWLLSSQYIVDTENGALLMRCYFEDGSGDNLIALSTDQGNSYYIGSWRQCQDKPDTPCARLAKVVFDPQTLDCRLEWAKEYTADPGEVSGIFWGSGITSFDDKAGVPTLMGIGRDANGKYTLAYFPIGSNGEIDTTQIIDGNIVRSTNTELEHISCWFGPIGSQGGDGFYISFPSNPFSGDCDNDQSFDGFNRVDLFKNDANCSAYEWYDTVGVSVVDYTDVVKVTSYGYSEDTNADEYPVIEDAVIVPGPDQNPVPPDYVYLCKYYADNVAVPSGVDFGAVEVGTTAQATISITNPGNEDLNIVGMVIEPSGAPFSIVSTNCGNVLVAGGQCEVVVAFTPGTRGTYVGRYVMESDALSGDLEVELMGQGVAPVVSFMSDPVDGGIWSVGDVMVVDVEVMNVGDSDLVATGAVAGAPWTVTNDGCTGVVVPPGGSCVVQVSAYAGAEGWYEGMFEVYGNMEVSPAGVVVRAYAGVPQVGVPGRVWYGNVEVGATASRVIEVWNTGTGTAHVSGVSLGNGTAYSIVSTTCGDVTPGATCDIVVDFLPVLEGSYVDTLVITEGGATHEVVLEGRGVVQGLDAVEIGLLDDDGNGVLDPGEGAGVWPVWGNPGSMDWPGGSGMLLVAGGPKGVVVDVGVVTYDGIGPGGQGSARSAYHVDGSGVGLYGHRDVELHETLSTGHEGRYVVHVGGSFEDIPLSFGAYWHVEALYHSGVTAGCDATRYCPRQAVTRGQMAVFVAKALEHAGVARLFVCNGVNITPVFSDIPDGTALCGATKLLNELGIVVGCGNGAYCPTEDITRGQMAVFIAQSMVLAGRLGGVMPCDAVTNPSPFVDVPNDHPACGHIKALYDAGVIVGCGDGRYCPRQAVTRGQMAVYLTNGFGLRTVEVVR